MEQITNICLFLCGLSGLIAPLALIAWIVMRIKKSEKKKKAKIFFLCNLAVFVLSTAVGAATLCEHEWETIVKNAPTCTESGTSIMHCSLCDTEKDAGEIPPKGHTFTEKTLQKANCTRTGLVEKTCSVCNVVESVTTEKSPHAYEVTSSKEATLEASGVEESTCTVCGDIKQKELAKLGTSGNPGKVTVEQLVSEINSNKDAAKAKYNEKWIEITGKVLDADNVAGMTRFYLYGEHGGSGLRIVCWVNKDMLKPFEYQGEVHTFLGQVREITTVNATEIGDCQIISK